MPSPTSHCSGERERERERERDAHTHSQGQSATVFHKPQATSHKPQATSHKPQGNALLLVLLLLLEFHHEFLQQLQSLVLWGGRGGGEGVGQCEIRSWVLQLSLNNTANTCMTHAHANLDLLDLVFPVSPLPCLLLLHGACSLDSAICIIGGRQLRLPRPPLSRALNHLHLGKARW